MLTSEWKVFVCNNCVQPFAITVFGHNSAPRLTMHSQTWQNLRNNGAESFIANRSWPCAWETLPDTFSKSKSKKFAFVVGNGYYDPFWIDTSQQCINHPEAWRAITTPPRKVLHAPSKAIHISWLILEVPKPEESKNGIGAPRRLPDDVVAAVPRWSTHSCTASSSSSMSLLISENPESKKHARVFVIKFP